MAGRTRPRRSAFDLKSMLEYARREAARVQSQAMAKARAAYDSAGEVLEDLDLPDAHDVIRAGVALASKKPPAPKVQNRAPAEARNARTGATSPGVHHSSPEQHPLETWLDNSPVAKKLAGDAVRTGMAVPGVAREAWNTVEDIAGAVGFGARLASPHHGTRMAAQLQAIQAGVGLIDAARQTISEPKRAVDDARRSLHDLNVSLNPNATPVEASFADEIRRNAKIGLNQGGAAFTVGSLLVGGPARKIVTGLGKATKATTAAEYVARGFSPGEARYLVTKYPRRAMGAHWVARSTRLPAVLGGGHLPKWFIDSPFNVLKPEGITRGDMYERHVRTDLNYNGGKIPKRFGGGSWSGAKYGWEKYGPVGRMWYGAPDLLKATVGGAGLIGAGAVVDHLDGEMEPR